MRGRMRRSVYIETTVPSFFVETRTEPWVLSRRESARRWWREEAPSYDLHVSAFVVGELRRGSYPGRDEALALVSTLPVLEIVPEVEEIAAVYAGRHLMPRGDMGDAFHLAAASYYGLDFLLTWNCRHLANANKTRHLQVVNTQMGLATPVITTPDLLLREEDADGPG